MVDIDQQLAAYGDAVERALLTENPMPTPVTPGPTRTARSRSRSFMAVVAAAAVLAVVAVWVGTGPGGDETVTTLDGHGLFPTPTDTVLVLIGNGPDLIVLDLDTGHTARHKIDVEQGGGDHPFWLAESDNHFIVGSGEIFAAPFDGTPRKIDDATIFLPSAHSGAVWTITYSGPYPRSTAEVRLVTVDGNVLGTYPGFDGERYEPLIGVPAGLAVIDRDTGRLSIWDTDTLEVQPLAPTAYIDTDDVDSNGQVIAWCTDACDSMSVHGLDQTGEPTAKGASWWISRIAISPDGARIATQTDTRLTIFERLPDGTYEPVHQYPIDAPGSIQWTDDSHQLFYSISQDHSSGILGRYDTRTQAWTTINLNELDYFLGALIALDRNDAAPFLHD